MSTLWEAMERRDDGIARAEANAQPPFNTVALELLREYAETHPRVFCDEFVAAMGHRLPETHNLRALGPVYMRTAREGWIVKSREARPSKASNLSLKPVWDSLIFGGRNAAQR